MLLNVFGDFRSEPKDRTKHVKLEPFERFGTNFNMLLYDLIQ